MLVPYLSPGLGEYRVWTAGEPLPLSGIFEFASLRRPAMSSQGATAAAVQVTDEELLRAALLPRSEPEVDQGQDGLPPAQALVEFEPAEDEQIAVGIEDPTREMDHFYERMLRVAAEEPDAVARIAVYGTSTNGADRATRSLRHAMAERFGDAGKGWVAISPGWRYHAHQDVEWSHSGWRTQVVNRGENPTGRYGFGGVVATANGAGALSRFGTVTEGPSNRSIDRFQIYYRSRPDGGNLEVQVDGGEAEVISTRSDEGADQIHQVEVERGPHEISVRSAGGAVELYGVAMENGGPGVVVDAVSLIGAFTRVLLNFDSDHYASQVRSRQSDLLMFWLGANDAVAAGVPFQRSRFVEQFTEILRRAQMARPESSCLVMSIMDKGERVGRFIRTHRRVPRVVDAQREAARNAGCAFFNVYEAMGGAGTMARWRRMDPRLVSGDLGHLTGFGSRVVGRIMYSALMQGLAAHAQSRVQSR